MEIFADIHLLKYILKFYYRALVVAFKNRGADAGGFSSVQLGPPINVSQANPRNATV